MLLRGQVNLDESPNTNNPVNTPSTVNNYMVAIEKAM